MSKPGSCFWNELQGYDIIVKECDFSFHVIYYLCFYALSILSIANQKKL